MACCGQFSTQVWQFMHSDMFTGSALPPSSLNTDCGQTFTQVPSPSHLFLSTVTMYMAVPFSSPSVSRSPYAAGPLPPVRTPRTGIAGAIPAAGRPPQRDLPPARAGHLSLENYDARTD